MKVRHKGMVIKPIRTPKGVKYKVHRLGTFDSEVAARRAIGRVRAKVRR